MMNRRRTDDGTYPEVEEARAKAEGRAAKTAVVETVTVTESSTTWAHGHLKVVMHTKTTNGVAVRSIKVIDMRPTKPHQYAFQWEGSLEEFTGFVGSLHLLSAQVREKQLADADGEKACNIEDDDLRVPGRFEGRR